MDSENLRLFIETARRGSFAAVARAHDLDPSSVSRALAALEAELGARLIHRTTRRMTLTEAGALLLARAEGLVRELEAARDEIRSAGGCPGGTLRLTTSVSFGSCYLAPLLPAFRAAYPDLKLELMLSDARLDLVAERIDLAIRIGRRGDADLVSAKLFDMHYRVCASPAYLRSAPSLLTPDDLAGVSCLLYALPEFSDCWTFRAPGGAQTEVRVQGHVSSCNALMLRECALRGLGPALLTDWLVEEHLRSGALVELFPDLQASATDFDSAVWLMYPSRAHLPRKVRAMIEFLQASRRASIRPAARANGEAIRLPAAHPTRG